MQLIVLGMHRSGTSVLARALNVMGAYFGPEGLSTGASAENPSGFWERKDVRSLNDRLLHAMGCDWDRVLDFDIAKLPSEVVDDFDRRAGRLVLEIDSHRPWLMKEPRLCLLYPLWRKFLDLPVCIHILRSPLEVAASLYTRNGIPVGAGMALWERHVRAAFRGSAGDKSIVVWHHALMTSPDDTLRALFDDLCVFGVGGLRMPSEPELQSIVRRDLYRERATNEALQAYADCSQMALFERLQRHDIATCLDSVPPDDTSALARYEAGLPTPQPSMPVAVPGAIARQTPALPAQVTADATLPADRPTDELGRAELRLAAHAGDLEKVKIQRQRAEDIAESRLRDLARLTRSLLQRDVQADGLIARKQRLLERVGTLKERVTSVRAERTQCRSALRGSARELAATKRKLGARVSELKARLASARSDTSSAEKSLATSAEDVAACRRSNTALQSGKNQLLLERKSLVRRTAILEKRIKAERARSAMVSDMALEEAQRLMRHAQLDAGNSARELDLIKHSRSWRLAAPLRAVARWSSRMAGRVPPEQAQRSALADAFDSAWYLDTYPDIAASGADPLEHFLAIGWREGRDPGAAFDTRGYLARNPDVANAGINPFVHYVTQGRAEGRLPC